MRKVFLLTIFFGITPVFYVFALIFALLVSMHTSTNQLAEQKMINFAALPPAETGVSASITTEKARAEIVRQFLARYSSPLEPYADMIVAKADEYGLDYRLIPAIAMQESTLCKKIPDESYNCWGFGIYGKTVTKFQDYPDAIDTVTRTLATKYKQKGLQTPEQIMSMYTPSSNGSWAQGVSFVMSRLQ